MKSLVRFPACVSMILLGVPYAGAQTVRTYSSTSGSDWRTATNWSGGTTFAGDAGGTVTGEGLATDIASFTAAYTSTNLGFNGTNLGGSLTLGAIVYNPASASGTFNSKTFGMSNTTGTLTATLRLDGATVDSVANTLLSVSSTAASGANFTVTNIQTGTTSAGQTLNVVFGHSNGVFNVATNRTLAFTNNLVDGASAGTGFTKTGGGTLTFGTNFGSNLSGKITLAGGQMRFQGANRTISNAIDVTASSTIYSNNVLTTLNTGAITLSDGVTLTFNSGGGSSNRFAVSNNIGLAAGAASANLTFNHDASNTNSFSGNANIGSGTFTKGSTATLNLSGSLTAGGITTNGGTFNVSGPVTGAGSGGGLTLTSSGTNSMTISGAITASSLTKSGTGTAVISGNNTGLTGDTTINGGILSITNSSALGSTGSVSVNSGSGNNLYLGASGITVSRPLTINGGGGVGIGALHYKQTTGSATYSGPITLTGVTQAGGHFGTDGTGGTLDLAGTITHTAAIAADRIVTVRAGSVQLSATGSTYNEIRLSEGLLKLGIANAIPSGAIVRVGDNSNNGNVSVFDLNGFDQTIAGLTRNNFGTGATSTVTNSSATAAALVIDTSADGSYSGAVTGNLSLKKQGGASFTLGAGTHSYTGATEIDSGKLVINGNITTSAVIVGNGGSLGGAGTISGATLVESGGILAPGNSPGTMSVENNLTLDLGAALSMEINGTGSGQFDRLIVTGGVFTFNGYLDVVLGYAPAWGDSFDLVDGTITGSPDFSNLPALGGGLVWDTTSFAGTGVIAVVPEASALLLAGIGAAVSLRRRRP